jgi:hypothetical protein
VLIDTGGHPGANNRPAEIATATSHNDTVDITNRPDAATAATRIAVTASANPLPAGPGITGSGSNARSHTVNTARTASARPANRRNQPRTVPTGRPNALAIGRCPTPAPFACSAAPITTAVSARRNSNTTGNNTCVLPHPKHRDRRGRIRTGPSGPRIVRDRP